MHITREEMIKRLSEKTGYYQKDVRNVLNAMDDAVLEAFNEVTDDEEISMQLVEGIKCGCKIVKSRERINPATQQPIICEPTCKPFAKFSQNFRQNIQEQYEEKRDG